MKLLLCALLLLGAGIPFLPAQYIFAGFNKGSSSVTFGNQNIGANNNSGSANPLCTKFTPGAGGSISTITWYGNQTTAGLARAAIVSDTAGSPKNILAQSAQTAVNTTPGWRDFSVSYTVTGGTPYWLCVSNNQNYNTQYDTGSANQFAFFSTDAGPDFLNPIDSARSPAFLAWAMSIYAH